MGAVEPNTNEQIGLINSKVHRFISSLVMLILSRPKIHYVSRITHYFYNMCLIDGACIMTVQKMSDIYL